MIPILASYPSSWFTDFLPGDPLGVVAASVLSGRFVAVLRYYPLAVTHAGDNVEHVHHLRVAARRCSAAIIAFEKILPRKLRDQADDFLRSIRKSAGLARDWDVFLMGIAPKLSPSRSGGGKVVKTLPKGGELLEGLALAHRALAQRKMAEACPDFGQSFPKVMEKIAESLGQSGKGRSSVSSLADSVLNEAFCDFRDEMALKDKVVPGAHSSKSGFDHLHRVRILGKRFRYLMEIFWRCLSKEVRNELYPLVEEAQELLGRINDHSRALTMIRELSDEVGLVSGRFLDRLAPRLRTLTRQHEKQIAAHSRAYQEWCHRWEKVEGSWDKD